MALPQYRSEKGLPVSRQPPAQASSGVLGRATRSPVFIGKLSHGLFHAFLQAEDDALGLLGSDADRLRHIVLRVLRLVALLNHQIGHAFIPAFDPRSMAIVVNDGGRLL